MSTTATYAAGAGRGNFLDERRRREQGASSSSFRKIFPDHWSFMLGEVALYSFIILLLTGTFLTFFFVPSVAQTTYNGSYPRSAASECPRPTPRRCDCRSTSAAACSCARSTTGRR